VCSVRAAAATHRAVEVDQKAGDPRCVRVVALRARPLQGALLGAEELAPFALADHLAVRGVHQVDKGGELRVGRIGRNLEQLLHQRVLAERARDLVARREAVVVAIDQAERGGDGRAEVVGAGARGVEEVAEAPLLRLLRGRRRREGRERPGPAADGWSAKHLFILFSALPLSALVGRKAAGPASAHASVTSAEHGGLQLQFST
jgi:hypothetical protein